VLCLLLGLAALAWYEMRPRTVDLRNSIPVHRAPRIRPEYRDLVIPPNIAPLNFVVEEPGRQFCVEISAADGSRVRAVSDTSSLVLPVEPWRTLLQSHRGQPLGFDVYVRGDDGRWSRFDSFRNTVADAEIDRYAVYRLIRPVYNLYLHMGIYQRDLESYEETRILGNASFNGGCVNCHAFANQSPDRMLLQVRGEGITGMVLVRDGAVEKVNTKAFGGAPAAYSAWHPGGRAIAFSINTLSTFYHSVGEPRDVYDWGSDIGVYLVDSNAVITSPNLADPLRLETFPAWSPDGRWLYFCSAPPLPLERFREIRYDLLRIRYDPERESFGELETVLAAKDAGGSLLEPAVSPDGRFLLVTVCDCGSFPVYQRSADLGLIDLRSLPAPRLQRLACNSPEADSWHAWSSNSRWIVFASKRRDGVFGRLYFSHISESGAASSPVLMPQSDPTFYDSCLNNYNRPELIRAPIRVSERDIARAILAAGKTKDAIPRAGPAPHGHPGWRDYQPVEEKGPQ
jgi:hypothetical protein